MNRILMNSLNSLPIDTVLPEIIEALQQDTRLVLVAPPGAGKTTRLPLVLKNHVEGKILVIEPRRLAARSAAARMAQELGEILGETIGYRVRFETKTSAKTRIELITEGVFTRMILDNPELRGVSLVIFDEFHERSLEADFGLALALDVQSALREDLKILVMSATLDGAAVSQLMNNARVICSEGRAYPVETRYLGRDKTLTLEEDMARAIQQALNAETGSLLAFLPGMGEIKRTSGKLKERVSCDIIELYGAMDQLEQSRAIAPSLTRKVVLATSIAETSITIEGVRVVIDSGYSRVPRFEPDIGVTRLETIRSPKAVNEQRKGRAGRTEPGICYRLWDLRKEGALPAFTTPEILAADLSNLVLDCAEWGSDPLGLTWQDPPPQPALNEAKALLLSLKALEDGRMTPEGRKMRRLPLSPRFARMVIEGEKCGLGITAVKLAVLLSERGMGGDAVNLTHRYGGVRGQALTQAHSWIKIKGADDASEIGRLLLFAYPERLAKARGKAGMFLLANGRGAFVEPTSDLASYPYLVVAEMTGTAQNTRILAAAPLDEEAVSQLITEEFIETTLDNLTLKARKLTRYGKITLKEVTLPVASTLENALLLARAASLPLTKNLIAASFKNYECNRPR
jgi:ATP-dependent helicase HrpB